MDEVPATQAAAVIVFCPACCASVDAEVTDTHFACGCGQEWTMTIANPGALASNTL